jgi:hypothetical protein
MGVAKPLNGDGLCSISGAKRGREYNDGPSGQWALGCNLLPRW